VPHRLGEHSRRVLDAAALLASKGRRARDRFLFEGETLVREARQSGLPIEALFVTQEAYDESALLRELDAAGTPLWIVGSRAARRLSDVETPTGIVAMARRSLAPLERILSGAGAVLVLAGVTDPGNAGTLLRSAEAFSAAGAIFGSGGVDPYHPKVVRAAMGSLFRIPVAVAAPDAVAEAARAAGRRLAGLVGLGGTDIGRLPAQAVLVVGQERRGLGPWEPFCEERFSIPIGPAVESLNAAVAGSIALFQASRRHAE